jgi:hypothetical protein
VGLVVVLALHYTCGDVVGNCWCVFGIKRSQQEIFVVSYYR